jgi:hypothetical protein
MKPPPSRVSLQLNLPLLNLPACVVPNDKQAELVLALVELLVGAAHTTVEDMRDGGDDERETHR